MHQIPNELRWIDQLLGRYGVAGTLRLLSTNLRDRARVCVAQAGICEAAAEQARRREPERIVDDPNERRDASAGA